MKVCQVFYKFKLKLIVNTIRGWDSARWAYPDGRGLERTRLQTGGVSTRAALQPRAWQCPERRLGQASCPADPR